VRGARSAWLVAFPVVLAGCLAAHTLAYVLAEPNAHHRHDLLAASGHGYLDGLPIFLAGALGVVLAGALWHAVRGRKGSRPSPWVFAGLPALAFALQEHAERLVHTGAVPLAAVLEPTFLAGLLLQIPFALLAWVLTRAILRAAEALGLRLRRQSLPRAAGVVLVPPAGASRRVARLAFGVSERGPPIRV
jgi:hypothetical protein